MRKRKEYTVILLFLVFLCLCITLTFNYLITAHRYKCSNYMNRFFGELTSTLQFSEKLAEESVFSDIDNASVVVLQYSLSSVADILEIGGSYVDKSVPAVAAWWFDSKASTLSNYVYAPELLPNDFHLSKYLLELHDCLGNLTEALSDDETLNLNPNISIEIFSQIIYDFYVSQTS